MESLRHQGISSGAGAGSRDPSSSLSSFRHRWNGLEEEVLNRQVSSQPEGRTGFYGRD